MVIFIRHKW